MKKYILELIGAFFIVLTIGLGSNPLAVGFTYVSMIYIGFNISGAHYNPVISTVMFLKKKICFKDLSFYIIFQIIGACLAALAISLIRSNMQVQPVMADSIYTVLFMESIFTFFIILAYLSISDENVKNPFYGFVVGLPLIVGVFSAAPVSGAIFNPVVSIGPSVIDIITGEGVSQYFLWYYIIGPLFGGFLAFLLNKYISK